MSIQEFLKIIKLYTNCYILDSNNNILFSGDFKTLKKNINKLSFNLNVIINNIQFSCENRLVLYLDI